MRLASVPSSAARGFSSQRAAMGTLEHMARAAGLPDAGALHASHLHTLLSSITARGAADTWRVDSADWHLMQTLLRQCGGRIAASVLMDAVPVLAKLLDPKHEPTLRLTGLSLLEQARAQQRDTTLQQQQQQQQKR